MRKIEIGRTGQCVFGLRPEHSAEAIGNVGVSAVSSAALIGFVENACGDAIQDSLERGEISVGLSFDVKHVAPAGMDTQIESTAKIIAVNGKKIEFEVEASADGRTLLVGRHRRAVIELKEFLERGCIHDVDLGNR